MVTGIQRRASPTKPTMHLAYSPYFDKIVNLPISANFFNFLHIFVQFTSFGLNLRFFGFPYFDHDAFTHHTLHVLDAPAGIDSFIF